MFTLAGMEDATAVVFMAVGGGVFAIWIIMATIQGIFKRNAVEQSRREIAAYVAEGSITPQDAERLLKAEPKNMGGD